MNEPRPENMVESHKEISTVPPAIELLTDTANLETVWPKKVARSTEFLTQLNERQQLNDRLDVILTHVPRPDMMLEDAIAQKLITEQQVADLYTSLTALLESEDYQRISLYLPFEFLPHQQWNPASRELQQAAQRLKAAYMRAWNNLLGTHDVRANFFDGDALDIDLEVEDFPRVVKAAHLIPILAQKGLLKAEDIVPLLEKTRDQTLRHSIADTLPVLGDLGLIHAADVASLLGSHDQYVRDKVAMINQLAQESPTPDAPIIQNFSVVSIEEQLHHALQKTDDEKYHDITPKREEWLRKEKKRKAILSTSDQIQAAITHHVLTGEMTKQFIAPERSVAVQQAFVDGVRIVVESAALVDLQQGRAAYAAYREALAVLYRRNIPALHDVLSQAFSRFYHGGIVGDEELRTLGITVPALAGPFSKNVKTIALEIAEIKKIVTTIENNPELSRLIYPVVLLFGSRLKGYGGQNTDIDVSVLIRPGIPDAEADQLRKALQTLFVHEKIRGEVVEFWLEQSGTDLRVRDLHRPEPWIGERSWTHVLFGAVWEGNEAAIQKLRTQLLVPYFYDDDNRGLYLEELERDTLQYRLMHKGYEKFFPPVGGINTAHADQIDGKSMFWDSGYRRMATKLFANRVFLPKISRTSM